MLPDSFSSPQVYKTVFDATPILTHVNFLDEGSISSSNEHSL